MVGDAIVQSINTNNIAYKDRDIVLLPTATVYLQNKFSIYGPFNALCDTASHINLIRTDACFNMDVESCHLQVWGVNDSVPTTRKHRIKAKLLTKQHADINLAMDFICVKKICCLLPMESFDKPYMPIEVNNKLANAEFNISTPIDILLGAYAWAKIVENSKIVDVNTDLIAQPTKLGLLIIGKTVQHEASVLSCSIDEIVQSTHDHKCDDTHLDFLLKRLFEIEHIPRQLQTEEQKSCEQVFLKEHYREPDGRFVVTMPLKENVNNIGDSRAIALKRFYQLERRFKRNPEIYAKYVEFMQNYEKAGHMCIADEPASALVYYIPHHCVTKNFRVVFDASSKSDNNLSLNETQMTGERLQSNIVDIVFRFRCFKVGFSADITQMYRQIKVNKKQWDLQRVFWRSNEIEPLCEYWLTCVTQGMTFAAHSAVRAMIQCGRDAKTTYPLAADIIQNNFYMDDCTSGAHDSNSAILAHHQLIDCLATGGFALDKWMSNDKVFLHAISANIVDQGNERILSNGHSDVLGLKWSTEGDYLSIKVNLEVIGCRCTKRRMLAALSRLYDPCGFITPIIIVGRMLMQRIWISKIDWDTVPSQ